MHVPARLSDDARRLEALRQYGLSDGKPAARLDDLATLAAFVCSAPASVITIISDGGQCISLAGLAITESVRDGSFCGATLLTADLFVVPDTASDERFRDNPLVTGAPHIRSFAAVPLVTPEGVALGALGVIDHIPRQLTPAQLDALRIVGRQLMAQLELRRRSRELDDVRTQFQVEASRAYALLAAFVDSSDDAIIARDLNDIITSWNSGAQRLFGYSAADMIGTSIARLIPRDRAGEQKTLLEKIRRGEPLEHFETARQTSSGEVIDVSLTMSPIRDASGNIIGVSKIARDISQRRRSDTARERAEAAEVSSEARYRTLFESAPDGIVIADRESNYIDGNPSICRMLGLTREEFIGLNARDIVVPSEIAHIGSALTELEADIAYHRQWMFRRKDGSVFTAEVSATAMPDGNYLGMIRDVTERDDAVRALRAAEERMRFALDAADVGIWDQDFKSGKLAWSETMEAHYGLEPGTFGGTVDAYIEAIYPDDRPAVLEAGREAAHAGGDFSVMHRVVWPDGSTHWLSGAGRVLLDDDGSAVRAVGISLDITARRALEEQFQQAQKMEAIGRLAGGIAHDFNNLLTAILGYCELLLTDFGPENTHRSDLAEIQKAGLRAAALTRQLLAFSRKQIIAPTQLALNVIVTELRSMLERLISENISIALALQPDLDPIMADRGQLEQIIMNLVVNARDAMPDGGTVRIETENVTFEQSYVALIVSDTGVGMTPQVQARVFEPFFTTKEVGKGTGLGLATVHGLVKGSGGSIHVHSEIGKGTSFRVYFPKAAPTERVVETVRPAYRPQEGGETVLVVEDETVLRELTRRLLRRQGYSVLVAANADEAVRVFEDHADIDVVLTDVVMPGLSGPELTKKLLALRPNLKVIHMSGYTEDTLIQHGDTKGGIAFLHKPFTSETLGRKLREVLG
ncbi:MAG: PAS domain S-box protein [bacterium]